MPEPTVTSVGEGNPARPVTPTPEEPADETAQPGSSSTSDVPVAEPSRSATPVEPADQAYRTIEVLKSWPAVLLGVQKSQEIYSSVKQRAGIVNWSLSMAEKVVGSFLQYAESKVSCLRPVVQCMDKAVGEGVEMIEKKFPILRESPEKLYDAVTQRITKVVRPTLDRIAAISEIGWKKLNRVAKKMTKKYHSVIRTVDGWMDALEKHLNGIEHEATAGAESVAAAVTGEQRPGRAWQALQLGARAAASVAAFQLGAAFWLLARAPLLGRVFRETPLPSPTHSSSSDVTSSSSSSSRLSPPAASQDAPSSRPSSVQSLHSEQELSMPQQ